MIIKKLLAPLVNEKILSSAEHCYIATAAISESGFDFILKKLTRQCRVEIVTGLDLPSSPVVLRRILTELADRVTLRVHIGNFFHPNAYAFDLPYRKRVAFIGSGNFTTGGLKDNEELAYQIKSEKEVEEIKSWFRRYFDESNELTEELVREYEEIYALQQERLALSMREKSQMIDRIGSKIPLYRIIRNDTSKG